MYVVKSGDNLSTISKLYYGNPNEYANDLATPPVNGPAGLILSGKRSLTRG